MADDALAPLILNAGDTGPLRDVKTRALRAAGFRVLEAETGPEALRLAGAEQPDLVLLDVGLPDRSGVALCRDIKRGWPEMLVLQVSAAFVAASDGMRGLEGGADAYMTQPAEPEELIASVRALLRLRAAERLAQANEARFRALIEASAQIVWTADATGQAIGDTSPWRRYTGQSEAEFAGSGWIEAVHPEDRIKAVADWTTAIATEGPVDSEYRLRHHGGGWRWILARATPVRDRDGLLTGWVGMNIDIDDRRRAEAALADHRDSLERLVEQRTAELLLASEEKRRAEEALRQSEKLAALGQLTGGVAHDFNNLLQVVSSGTNLLRSGQLAEADRTAVLDSMARAGESARELTGRLLAFARRQTLRPEAFSLAGRLAAMAESLKATLGPLSAVETVVPAALWPVHADPVQFEVALLNLAGNARDAMPGGGVLWISGANATVPGPDGQPVDQVCIAVTDQGMGMAPAVLERAFEPFFTTKDPGRGTGLGLAQVHGFVSQSKGSVSLRSAPGEGTTVTLHLPAARAGSARSGATGAVIDALRSSAGRRVLVVEDNADAGAFAAALLRELGYATSRAASGDAALAQIEAGEVPDAVFSDIAMPGKIDGVSLAEALRERHPSVAMVLATGYSERLVAAGSLPGVEVLQKPYRLDELAAALGRALGAGGA